MSGSTRRKSPPWPPPSASTEEFQRRYVRKVGIRKSLIELPGGDCVFFHRESGSCQVYQQRPRQCRTWPFWHSNLATPAAWREMCRVVRAAIAARSSRCGQSAPAWSLQRVN